MLKQMTHHKRHHWNWVWLVTGVAFAGALSASGLVEKLLPHLHTWGYLAAPVAGIMFTSTFTVASGMLVLLTLAKTLSPIALILLGVIGAVAGDWLIFRFVRHQAAGEVAPIFKELEKETHLHRIMHTRYFAWTLPVIGAFIIVSPLPDELGVSLLGMSQMTRNKFLVVSAASHAVGMTFILLFSWIV
ncbi:MAG: hypothetical protein ABH807_02375 [Candidatus Shapirobacteria bacterium]